MQLPIKAQRYIKTNVNDLLKFFFEGKMKHLVKTFGRLLLLIGVKTQNNTRKRMRMKKRKLTVPLMRRNECNSKRKINFIVEKLHEYEKYVYLCNRKLIVIW